ncbi:hypothetical protein EV363DRAFT_1224405, partial [Boletus edulis]
GKDTYWVIAKKLGSSFEHRWCWYSLDRDQHDARQVTHPRLPRDRCASHVVCDHGSGGYLVSVSRPLCGPWISYIQVSSARVRVPPAILSAPGGCAGSGRRLPGK